MALINQKSTRRSAIRTLLATVATAGAGLFGISAARAKGSADEGSIIKLPNLEKFPESESQGRAPLFSGATIHNGFVFIAGKGEHGEGDIRVHTEKVLDKIEEELERAGAALERARRGEVQLHQMRAREC